MPSPKTLLQTLLAAFCAILCTHLSALGGGGMNIGARTGCWAKSGYTALDYVGAKEAKAGQTSPLIAMWDGIENAGWGVHDPNATTWKDLSGNGEDITLRSGAYWSLDCLCQDTQHGSFGSWHQALDGYRQIEGVFRNDSPTDAGGTNGRVCLVSFHNYAPYDFQFGIYQGLRFGNYVGNAPILPMNTIYEKMAFSFAINDAVSQPAPIAAYKNGLLSQAVGVAYYGASGTGLGGGANNARAMSGAVFNLRLYSRNLTAAEIAANYAVDKARFGLT